MPYADDKKTGLTGAERKRAQMKKWRDENITRGYGKWLYARRKLRFDDAEAFREVLETIIFFTTDTKMKSAEAKLGAIHFHASAALEESRKAAEALGGFKGKPDA